MGEVQVTTNGHRKRGRGIKALIPDLAEGSHQGNEPVVSIRDIAEDVFGSELPGVQLPPPHVELRGICATLVDPPIVREAIRRRSSANELREQLDLATTLLRQLVGALARQGSYMPPEDQDALRAARRFLVDRPK